MKRAVRVGGAVVLAAALFVAGGIGLFRSSGGDGDGAQARGRTTSNVTADTLLAPAIGGSLDQTIEDLQSRLRALPTDWQAFASLGLAYVQQARVTADPSYYPKAHGVLRRSLGLERDDNFAAMVGMAALAAARHDFAGALRWGERGEGDQPVQRQRLRRDRRRAGGARPLPGRVRDVPDHGRHPPRRRFVRPRLVRARTDGRCARRASRSCGGCRPRPRVPEIVARVSGGPPGAGAGWSW